VKSTKSGEERKFVMPDQALAVLAEHREKQEDDKRLYGPTTRITDWSFASRTGSTTRPIASAPA